MEAVTTRREGREGGRAALVLRMCDDCHRRMREDTQQLQSRLKLAGDDDDRDTIYAVNPRGKYRRNEWSLGKREAKG
eukprot:480991-Pyramimonas_sp.AAC.1